MDSIATLLPPLSSSYFLSAALAVQRYIFVCHPTLAKTWCTVTKSSRLVALVVSLAIVTTSSRIMDRTYFVWAPPGEKRNLIKQYHKVREEIN